MKKFWLLIICLFAWIGICEAEKIEVQLDSCVDGDTVSLILKKEKTKFRFLAVDTPESVHPKKKAEPFGKEASEYTCNMLTNAEKIEIEYDAGSDKTDKYSRHLAWIWVDNVLLQQLLVKNGLAEVAYIYGDYKYTMDLCKEQSGAVEAKLGIWESNREEKYCSTITFKEGTILDVDTFDVTFKNDDKTSVIPVLNSKLVKEPTPPKKDNYVFVGWYLNDKLFDFNTPITGDIVLEAKYKIDYFSVILIVGLIIISLLSKSFYKKGKKKKHG